MAKGPPRSLPGSIPIQLFKTATSQTTPRARTDAVAAVVNALYAPAVSDGRPLDGTVLSAVLEACPSTTAVYDWLLWTRAHGTSGDWRALTASAPASAQILKAAANKASNVNDRGLLVQLSALMGPYELSHPMLVEQGVPGAFATAALKTSAPPMWFIQAVGGGKRALTILPPRLSRAVLVRAAAGRPQWFHRFMMELVNPLPKFTSAQWGSLLAAAAASGSRPWLHWVGDKIASRTRQGANSLHRRFLHTMAALDGPQGLVIAKSIMRQRGRVITRATWGRACLRAVGADPLSSSSSSPLSGLALALQDVQASQSDLPVQSHVLASGLVGALSRASRQEWTRGDANSLQSTFQQEIISWRNCEAQCISSIEKHAQSLK